MAEVPGRLGMTTHSLYAWMMKYGPNAAGHEENMPTEQEVRNLKKELKRVTEERDILKKPQCISPTSPTEVHLHSGAQSQPVGVESLPFARRASEWLQRMAQATTFTMGDRQRTTNRTDQAVLV